MVDYKIMLKEKFPYLTDLDCDIIIGYVKEAFLDVLQVDDIPLNLQNTFAMRLIGVVEQAPFQSFEQYSENGLSVVIDREFITKGLVPKVRRKRDE